MLKSIVIKNLALIGDAELSFGSGLNVLSGETGAGKSIIVDAIMLLLGGKYDKSLLRYGSDKGMVEGVFYASEAAKSTLESMGIDEDDEVIVTRRFFIDGRNDIRINGRQVTAAMLRRLTERLVDIYGQHEYISLAKASEQERIFDYYIREQTANDLALLSEKSRELSDINKKLDSLGADEDRERLIDILKYQIEEIEKAHIKKGEEEELTEKRRMIASLEKINSALGTSLGALSENEINAVGLIENAASALGSISNFGESYDGLYNRLKLCLDELDDVAECVRDELDKDFDEADLDKIEERLSVIKNIKKKYGDFDGMTAFYNDCCDRLYGLINSDKIYAKLESEKQRLLDEIYAICLRLDDIRRKLAKGFESEIEGHLGELSMKEVTFRIVFAPFPTREDCEKYLTASGMDRFEFYFSANKGRPPAPMTKVVSGGEMSRFMLALKVAIGERDDIPTMIFDEIDSGISGITGRAVAEKLAKLAISHQVLCVTHLAQIAAMADTHFFIEKKTQGDDTLTSVAQLDENGMIKEIARLSGVSVSSLSEAAAAELKDVCNEFKRKSP